MIYREGAMKEEQSRPIENSRNWPSASRLKALPYSFCGVLRALVGLEHQAQFFRHYFFEQGCFPVGVFCQGFSGVVNITRL
jgi:hypothetical protein